MEQVDILIAGAGPAGCMASLLLARAGQRVLMIDRINATAVKLGDTLAPLGGQLLHSLGLGHLLQRPHQPIRGQISLWDGRGEVSTDFFASAHGPAWRLDRPRFDHDLRLAAAGAGAVLVEGHLDGITRAADCWCVRSSGYHFRSRRLIDATGRRAWIARCLGARIQHDDDQVALYGLWRPDIAIGTDRTLVERCQDGSWWYGARLADGRAVAGLHLPATAAAKLRRTPDGWRKALGTTRLIQRHLGRGEAPILLPPHAASGSLTNPSGGDGWQAIGDANMAFDPISGFGLHAAIQDASWLAEGVDDLERWRRRAKVRSAYLRSMLGTKA